MDGWSAKRGKGWRILIRPWRGEVLDYHRRYYCDADSGSWLAFSGRPLHTGSVPARAYSACDLLSKLVSHSFQGLRSIRGTFAIIWFDANARKVHFIRDQFGVETLYYRSLGNSIFCATHARQLGQMDPVEFSPKSIRDYLLYSYLPSNRTLFEGTTAVPQGSAITVDLRDMSVDETEWYRLSYAVDYLSEQDTIEQYRDCLVTAVRRQVGDGRAGCMISGGMDSSAVLSIMAQSIVNKSGPEIATFGFRCPGPSFDESIYARQLAQHWHSNHTETLFGPAEALQIADAIQVMDNPFSDIGIELGTWSVASAASGNIDYVLTGDGGDEIWASHPVYAAQRMVKYYDKLPIPTSIKNRIFSALQKISDSSKKRDLRVIAKRLLPSPELPRELKHFRWRIVMRLTEIRASLSNEAAEWVLWDDAYDGCMYAFDGFDGGDDGMSDMLFNDYYTASSFYFRRLDFYRHFGIEPRVPFFDVDLVEVGAKIPAKLKLEGIERTKRLFRTAMRGIVPGFILDRKDKLGHSIPLKNWLRDKCALRELVYDTLLSNAMLNRGIFNRSSILNWLDDHDEGKHNYSHRIWAVFVMELWFQSHSSSFKIENN